MCQHDARKNINEATVPRHGLRDGVYCLMRRFIVYSTETGEKVVLAKFVGRYAQLDAMRWQQSRGIPMTYVQPDGYAPSVRNTYGD